MPAALVLNSIILINLTKSIDSSQCRIISHWQVPAALVLNSIILIKLTKSIESYQWRIISHWQVLVALFLNSIILIKWTITYIQGKKVILMFFPDVLKFFNRLGVRPVNDVTAHVTAEVTAAMDPEGMGAHMGPEALPPVITVEMLREREESLVHIVAKTMTLP